MFPSIAIPIAKTKQIPNIQMEHSSSIIYLKITKQKNKIDKALYDNNVFDLLDIISQNMASITRHI